MAVSHEEEVLTGAMKIPLKIGGVDSIEHTFASELYMAFSINEKCKINKFARIVYHRTMYNIGCTNSDPQADAIRRYKGRI